MKLKIFLIIIAILVYAFFNFAKKDLDSTINRKGAELPILKNFQIEVRYDENFILAKDKNSETNKIRIKAIQNLTKTEADNYIKEQNALLQNTFDAQLPPYPEFLTNQTGCDEKFKPIAKSNKFGRYYFLYAGERFGYGICSDDLIAYRSLLGFFYCQKSKTLFKIEYFTDKNASDKELEESIAKSFKCL